VLHSLLMVTRLGHEHCRISAAGLPRCALGLSAYWRREALLPSRKQLRVDVQDITAFDADLSNLLQDNPSEYLPLVCMSEG